MVFFSRKKIIIANLKMYLSNHLEMEQWLKGIQNVFKSNNYEETILVVCPPFVFLEKAYKELRLKQRKNIFLGAQDCFWESRGAFTGEVGATMLVSQGVKYVILGHSERRRLWGEDNQVIAIKIKAALKEGLIPLLCIGENARERKRYNLKTVLYRQLKECLSGVGKGRIEDIIICYEPVWAISANGPRRLPTTNEIMEAGLIIKKFLVEEYGERRAKRMTIIYGGSVSRSNAWAVSGAANLNGVLVGKASTSPFELAKIMQQLDKEGE